MKKYILLTAYLLIALGSYCQVSDTLCINKQRAIELIKAEISLKACDSVATLQNDIVKNLRSQIDYKDEQIGSYIGQVNLYKDIAINKDKQIELQNSQIAIYDKKLKRQKFKAAIISAGAVIVEALTLYLWLTK